MKDIVERLRDCPANYDCIGEAAAEIERLRKINTKLQRDLSDRISDIFDYDAEIERLRIERDRMQATNERLQMLRLRKPKEKTHEPG